jgi:hypothetical protein
LENRVPTTLDEIASAKTENANMESVKCHYGTGREHNLTRHVLSF